MMDLVDLAEAAVHAELERKARAEPRANNAAAPKRLQRYVKAMLRQRVRGKR
jgi:hypothetical protein